MNNRRNQQISLYKLTYLYIPQMSLSVKDDIDEMTKHSCLVWFATFENIVNVTGKCLVARQEGCTC
jgi:hypothetical protein